ncbi:hypothetical protein [Proteiniclasticum sp.]|uniref:hypothetical protein n=1 Tax=Proteiniclasticum sp. TaxID=2053595 RepID=UPI0028A070CC|nr:hypothetical protein [Proteiniclasticum sp.]
MFYFLLILGSGLIIIGLQQRKRQMPVDAEERALTEALSDVYARRGMDYENTELAADLNDRMEELEKTLFEQLMKWQLEKEELIQKLEVQDTETLQDMSTSVPDDIIPVIDMKENEREQIEPQKTDPETKSDLLVEPTSSEEVSLEKKPVPDNIRSVMDYEDEGLSVEEIAKITRMKKGEVLLLKNLSKHYRK